MTELMFSDLGLADRVQRAVASRQHITPTPIQEQAIPKLLKGFDVLGIAQTGTGKTAAFALPILSHMAQAPLPRKGNRHIRALIMAPTRELAIQIGEEFKAYAKNQRVFQAVIFGGVSQKNQVEKLRRGVDILVATPGRLLDLMNQGYVDLSFVESAVLDEADRMLDMGFIHDVRKVIAALPEKRQSLMFSATMPGAISKLSAEFLSKPVRIEVTPQATPVERIRQTVYYVGSGKKQKLLRDILEDQAFSKVIVFTRMKYRANRVAEHLEKVGISATAIHGSKSQGARQRALKSFKEGRVRVLVATDIAARGIDIEGITHVINFEIPNEPESYVHRIGRTARAGAAGAAVSFCDPDERYYLRDIERLMGLSLTVVGDIPTGEIVPAPKASRQGIGKPSTKHRKDQNAKARRPRRRRKKSLHQGSAGKVHPKAA